MVDPTCLPGKRKAEDESHHRECITKLATTASVQGIVREAVSNDLQHIFEEIPLDRNSQRILQELGVTSIPDILKMSNDLKDTKIGAIRQGMQEKLHHFCLWHEEFFKKNNPDAQWREAFTGESFDEFEKQLHNEEKDKAVAAASATTAAAALAEQSAASRTRKLFHHAVDMLHEEGPGNLQNLSEEQLESLYSYVAQQVSSKLPDAFQNSCQFDVDGLVKTCAKAIFNLPTGEPYPKIQVVAGKTQAGKSNVKAVVQATCDILFCRLFIIAKGVAEAKELAKKVADLLDQDKSKYRQWLSRSKSDKALDVIPDTAARIKRAIKIVRELRNIKTHGKFCVIVDECDAMYRTEERNQQFELAYDELMGLRPALRIEISATPIPALLVLADRGHEVDMLELGTSDDYSGILQMVPLKEPGSKKHLFLTVNPKDKINFGKGVHYNRKLKMKLDRCDNDLLFPEEDSKDKPFEFEARAFHSQRDKLDFIPCTDDSVMKCYDDAVSDPTEGDLTRKGVLLLDCTISRVTAEQNIFQKASLVQNHYRQRGKDVVIILVVGSGIYVRRPGFLYGRKISNRKTVSEVIERLDQEFGLEMPFFVFGYSKMKRCISYRSETRVPTHMILFLGLTQSNENFIQAIGRVSFNGLKTVLAKNGFSQVTVLTPKGDYKMAQRYSNFVHEVCRGLKAGKTIAQVLHEEKKKFKDTSNYLRFTNRKTGQIKNLKNQLPDQDRFEDPDDDDDDDESFDTQNDTTGVMRVMRAVFDLVHDTRRQEATQDTFDDTENHVISDSEEDSERRRSVDDTEEMKAINREGFTTKAIRDTYNETYQENGHTIKAGELQKLLNQLKAESKLEKLDNGNWRAKNWVAFKSEVEKMI